MSTTEQQAAATITTTQLTDAEKKRLANLPSQIYEAELRANAPNPGGSPDYLARIPKDSPNYRQYEAWQRSTAENKARAEALRAEYETLKAKAPATLQSTLAEGGKRSRFESDAIAVSQYGGNVLTEDQYHFSSSPNERKTQEGLANLAAYYPYATQAQVLSYFDAGITETELAQKDAERASAFGEYSTPKQTVGFARRPGPPKNVTINYEATLAARQQGFNVGSALYNDLPETFQKEENKRFAERNKFIGLTENITTERAKQITEAVTNPITPQAAPVTPQRERAKTIHGSMDRAFAAPGYAQRGSDAYKGIKQQVHILDSSLPAGRAELRTGAFELEGQNATAALFGIAPRYPRVELTQEDIDKMSPAEYAAYRKEFDVYKQYADYATEQARQVKSAGKIISQVNWATYKSDLLKYIQNIKDTGATQITILTKSGLETIPINNAFLNLASRAMSKTTEDDVLEVFTPPVIPKGYSVVGVNLTGEGFTEFGSNPVGTLLVAPTEPQKPVETKEKTGEEFWSEFVGNVQRRASEITSNRAANPVARVFAAGGQVGAEIAGGFVLLGGEISRFKLPDIRKAAGELFNGTTTNETEPNPLPPGYITDRNINQTQPPAETPPPLSAPGELLTGLSTGAYAAAQARNPSLFYAGAREAAARFASTAQKQGILPTVVQTALYVDPFALIKAVPLRTTKLVISTESGPRVVESVISLGYGAGKVIGGRYGEAGGGRFFLGKPNPAMSGIEGIRGATGSSFNVYELAGYTKRELGLLKPVIEYAEKKGLAPFGAFEQEMRQAEALQIFKKLQIKYERGFVEDELKTISPGIKSKEALVQGAKAQEQSLLDKMKGSAVFTKIKGSLKRQYSDIDFTAKQDSKIMAQLTKKRKEVESLEKEVKRAEATFMEMDIDKQTALAEKLARTRAEVTVLEKKVSEPAIKAAEMFMEAPVEPGFAYGRSGSNVFIGEAEIKTLRLIPDLDESMAIGKKTQTAKDFGVDIEVKIVKPGTEKEVFNIVTEKEDLIDAIRGKGGKNDTVFGYKQPKDEIKLEIEDTGKKLKSEGAKQQLTNKVKSVSGFMTKETIAEATNLTEQQKAEILGENLFVFGGKAHRYVKENVHAFMGFREGARIAFEAGKRKEAEKIGQAMAGMIRMKKGIDWGKEIREYKPELEIPVAETKEPETLFASVQSGASGVKSVLGKTHVQPYTPITTIGSAPITSIETSNYPQIQQDRLTTIYDTPKTSKFTRTQKQEKSPMVSPGTISSKSFSVGSGKAAFAKSPSAKLSGDVSPKTAASPISAKPSPGSAFSPSPSSKPSPFVPSPSGSPLPSSKAPSPLSPSPSPGPSPAPSPGPSPGPSPSPSPFKQPTPYPYPKSPPPQAQTGWLKVRTQTDKGKEKKKKPDDFLGNVPEEQISGMFKRKEITTGIERTAKLLKKDTAYTRKKAGFTKLVTQRQGSILSKKKQSILSREDKKEVKKQKKKTGGFF